MITVIKATGEKEPFSEKKLISSIKRAGIPLNVQTEVIKHVEAKLYNNIPTSEIYHHISEFLKHTHPSAKARYSLKRAIMALGPTGYPFEDYVSEVLKEEGYTTQTRTILSGTCISHEIDVIAEKQGKRCMVEAKFHNLSGAKTNVHVALYTKARFDDVKKEHKLDEAWLVTNTKVTEDAVAYALCMDMKIVSWSYPQGKSLRDLVEKYLLHPITVLNSLSQNQKQILLENHVVLCRDLYKNPLHFKVLDLDSQRKEKVMHELDFLTQPPSSTQEE